MLPGCSSPPRSRQADRRRCRAPSRARSSKAGIAATTAPKPTRLATATAGRTDALAPASIVCAQGRQPAEVQRDDGRDRGRQRRDHSPYAADREREMPPHRSSARKPRSSAGRISSDMPRLTRTTTASGNTAIRIGHVAWRAGHARFRPGRTPCPPRRVRAGARRKRDVRVSRARPHRTLRPTCSAAAADATKPPRPKQSMIAEAMTPSPGAANGVVPKKGIGMAFCIDGVPGKADIVKVDVPSTITAGISRRGMPADRNSCCAIGARTKKATKRLTPP